MTGLVLAAGLGTRLRPLTDHLPKPLVPVCDTPCIDAILTWLAEAGVARAGINTHWLSDKLHAHLGHGDAYGLELVWRHEPELLEGMGTLKACEHLFGDQTVICVNGDIVLDLDLGRALAAHRASGAAMTLVTVPHHGPMIHPVAWSDTGRLRGIRRTGLDDPAGRFVGVFSGVHLIEPEIWRRWLPASRPQHLTRDLMPRLVAAGVPVHCHLDDGLWVDVGSFESLDRAHVQVLSRHCLRYLAGAQQIAHGVFVRGDAKLDGAVRPPVYLGPGARLSAGAVLGPYAALGAGAVLGDGERLAYGVRLGAASPANS